MSRIGKKPISIPSGVTVSLKGKEISIKGPKGTLQRSFPPNVNITVEGSEVRVSGEGKTRKSGAFQGLARALLADMVKGVTEGFKKNMSIVGVGYRVSFQGNKLLFNLGFSHQIEYPLPKGIEAEVGDRGVNFVIKGIDKELVGQTCATIRNFRPPEPYKGKGVRYTGEMVRQKAGKTSAK